MIKIILIQKLNKIIFITPLADISACFKQKLTQILYFLKKTRHNILSHLYSKSILIQEWLDIYTRKQDKY